MLQNAGFESLIVLSMESSLETTAHAGVAISAIVQFGSDISQEVYETEWNILTNDSQKLQNWYIADSNVTSKDK